MKYSRHHRPVAAAIATTLAGLIAGCGHTATTTSATPIAPASSATQPAWQTIEHNDLATVEVERKLYDQSKESPFFIHLRVTNTSDRLIGLDLTDYQKVIYPNQWGWQDQPERMEINEIRSGSPLTPQDKARIMQAFRQSALTMLKPGEAAEFFREFNANRMPRDENGGKYLMLSLDGEIVMADERDVTCITCDWDGGSKTLQAELTLPTPIAWGTIPPGSLLFVDNRVTGTVTIQRLPAYPQFITNFKEALTPYLAALDDLRKGTPREKMAPVFSALPDPYAQEIGTLMAQMAAEDKQFIEPPNPAKLSDNDRRNWLVYKLRDLNAEQFEVPGKVKVLEFAGPDSPAFQLREMGKAAVPTLIGLLNDRRPTRSSGDALCCAILLRYNDVALEILESISGQIFDGRTVRGSYLSSASPDERTKIIGRVLTWWKEHQNSTEADWIHALLAKDGIGRSGDDHTPQAKRLIELEGPRAVNALRQCRIRDPNNLWILIYLWDAGGKEVLDDLKQAAHSANTDVRSTARSLLIKAGQKEYLTQSIEDLARAVAHPSEDYAGQGGEKEYVPLMNSLAWSNNPDSVLTVAKYMNNADGDVAWRAVQAVLQSQQTWEPANPTLLRQMLPNLMSYINLNLSEPYESNRFDIATTIVRTAKISIDWPEKMPPAAAQAEKIKQLQAWWKEHEQNSTIAPVGK